MLLATFRQRGAPVARVVYSTLLTYSYLERPYKLEPDLLESMPATSDPAVKKRIADARASAERMRSEPGADGMEQLSEKAHDQEHERDHAMHRNHILEIASGGLQIAIVLASISVVINLPAFMLVSVLVGGASAIYALLGGFSLLH